MKKLISLLLALTLVLGLASVAFAQEASTEPEWDENHETIPLHDGKTYGLGDKVFAFQVIDGEENVTSVTVLTDAETVGDALAALDIVAGEDSEFGLYVKTINGITADYETDGTYWAFYIDGEYAMTGVDATEINEEAVYTFAIEK